MKVLVVEDDPIVRRVLETCLRVWGEDVVTAADGAEGWALFQSGGFALVITDWTMPEMDGVELCRRIRDRGGERYVYVIILTGKSNTEDLVRGMDAGADDFIGKPFDRDELRVRVRQGERVVRLERTLAEQNEALRRASEELEERVQERTLDLARTNAALRREIAERRRAMRELEATQAELLRAEHEKKQFYREVIRAVTEDRFHLLDPKEIETPGEPLFQVALDDLTSSAPLREPIRRAAQSGGMPPEQLDDLLLAVGEAAANATKHGTDGRCVVHRSESALLVTISDRGTGIRPEDLPASILLPGFSTKVSLGMGYTLMLKLVDRLRLSTGPSGTIVQLEKSFRPAPADQDALLLAALDRF